MRVAHAVELGLDRVDGGAVVDRAVGVHRDAVVGDADHRAELGVLDRVRVGEHGAEHGRHVAHQLRAARDTQAGSQVLDGGDQRLHVRVGTRGGGAGTERGDGSPRHQVGDALGGEQAGARALEVLRDLRGDPDLDGGGQRALHHLLQCDQDAADVGTDVLGDLGGGGGVDGCEVHGDLLLSSAPKRVGLGCLT